MKRDIHHSLAPSLVKDMTDSLSASSLLFCVWLREQYDPILILTLFVHSVSTRNSDQEIVVVVYLTPSTTLLAARDRGLMVAEAMSTTRAIQGRKREPKEGILVWPKVVLAVNCVSQVTLANQKHTHALHNPIPCPILILCVAECGNNQQQQNPCVSKQLAHPARKTIFNV